jgi:hypothetical protein
MGAMELGQWPVEGAHDVVEDAFGVEPGGVPSQNIAAISSKAGSMLSGALPLDGSRLVSSSPVSRSVSFRRYRPSMPKRSLSGLDRERMDEQGAPDDRQTGEVSCRKVSDCA